MRTCCFWSNQVAACGLTLLLVAVSFAQPGFNPGPGQNNFNGALGPGAGPGAGNAVFGPGAMLGGGRGGAAAADFDSLIDLIQSTVATETWAENGGGEADIRPFPNGVLVDAGGMLRQKTRADLTASLVAKRGAAPAVARLKQPQQAAVASAMRYISLPRFEREIARRQAAHQPLDSSMLTLAGLQRVEYVFAYPETGDLVLAGPAGDWTVDEGRIVSKKSRAPVVRLDDLLALLRRGGDAANSHFGCSINPRQESLAKTQEFIAASSKKPLQPSQRKQWLSDLRNTVGRQDIEIFGIDPASRAAGVLVEADYHMKLVGMGLADGVDGVESYLKSIHLRPGEQPPAMSVLRWWFALKYDAVARSEANDAFQLIGQGVRVLSENEMLTEQGQRVHTGQSDMLNRQFAESFTTHFAELSDKYPVYGELRNIFDLAIAVALIQSEGLADRVGWKPTVLTSADKLRLPKNNVPREVETVINHRIVNERTILAGVSGGVMVEPGDALKQARAKDSANTAIERAAPAPKNLAAEAWWWDSPK